MSTKLVTSAAVITTGIAAGLGIIYLYRRSAWKKRREEKLKRIMSMLDSESNCHMKDSAALRGKIRTILEKGNDCLQVLTDFDKTLTCHYVEDEYGGKINGHSSFQVIEESSQLGATAAEELKALFKKYYPIEMSPTISSEEKTPLMIEWYGKSFNVGVNAGIRKSLLPIMVKETHVVLRQGMNEFLRKVEQFKIPVLVASAGLGDVINEVFIQQCELPPQVSVLANFYDFDPDGVALGLKNEVMLHTFNKDKICSIHKPYFDNNRNRTNALVMGDTLGDPILSNGIEYLKCILKVGFLNSNVEASLPQYMSAFDLVLTGDPPIDILTVLLHELFSE